MIYFIGGAARCGKSTLARKLAVKIPSAYLLSGDSMRQAVKQHIPRKDHKGLDTNEPEQYIEYYSQHATHAVDELLRQGEAVWQYIERYTTSLQLEGAANIIVDGIDIWPQHIISGQLSYKSVFLVDSSPDQWQRVTEHQDEHDWIRNRKLTTEQVKAWANFSAVRSKRIIELCQKHQLPYLDISNMDYMVAQDKAEEILLS